MTPYPPPTPRQALWLQRLRQDLPAAAARRGDWPIRLDHCFARVILDEVCGGPWRRSIAAPAWRNLDPAALDAALALADAMLEGRADVGELNRRSLAARRRHGRPSRAICGDAPPQAAAKPLAKLVGP